MADRPNLLAALATARALVASLEAAVAADDPFDDVLTLTQIQAEFGYGDEALRAEIARGNLAATRGPRQRIEIRRSELERWRASRPVTPRPRRKRHDNVVDLDAWDREADRQLGGQANASASGGPE